MAQGRTGGAANACCGRRYCCQRIEHWTTLEVAFHSAAAKKASEPLGENLVRHLCAKLQWPVTGLSRHCNPTKLLLPNASFWVTTISVKKRKGSFSFGRVETKQRIHKTPFRQCGSEQPQPEIACRLSLRVRCRRDQAATKAQPNPIWPCARRQLRCAQRRGHLNRLALCLGFGVRQRTDLGFQAGVR